MGSFARRRQVGTVWVGLANAPPVLLRLQQRICEAAIAADLVPDTKPFHPHITVGRGRGVSMTALRPMLERHGQSAFGDFEVSGFTLYASVLHPHGPVHSTVFRQNFP